MFVGRQFELENLNKYYKKDSFQCIVMYGRRRIGKTRLLNEFIKDKKSVYLAGEQFNEAYTLEKFTEAIKACFGLPDSFPVFKSYKDCFDYIVESSDNDRIVVVLDEFQYVAKTNKNFLSFLQNYIDHKLINTKLYLVLCGSVVSFMEKEVLAYKSPLFGRRTAQFIINPLSYFEAIQFFPEYSYEDLILTYSILGGIPQYLLQFDSSESPKNNIKENILNKSSYLHLESNEVLKQELRELAVYNSIIKAIATGYTKINEISTKINEPGDKTSKYILALIRLHLVKRCIPFGEKENTKKSYYKITDNFLSFFYRYGYSNSTLIELNQIDTIYEKKIEPFLSQHTSRVFEDICVEYLKKKNKSNELPFIFEEIGNWWGNNPVEKKQEEIDIIASEENQAIFAECKWTDDKLDTKTINNLIRKSDMFNYKNKFFYFFSKSGFTESAQERAKKENIYLIDLITLHK
jgi:AAA+ ATPase superfamily predicted ATPase